MMVGNNIFDSTDEFIWQTRLFKTSNDEFVFVQHDQDIDFGRRICTKQKLRLNLSWLFKSIVFTCPPLDLNALQSERRA